MNKQDKIKALLSKELLEKGNTHEVAPPGHDCTNECSVSFESVVAASNPITSPMRSDGKKHKRCMDCWVEYVNWLADKIIRIKEDDDKT